MIKRRRNRKYRLIVLTAVVLIVTVLLSVCFYKMHPVIITNAVSVAETIMLNSANEAVVSILEAEDFTYDDIVNLTYNSDGYVTSLEIDIYEVNFLKSKISNEVAS
ncbi:MAG: hypothetical protein IJ432_06385, partial [Clostridia bacterium]|nr:hypothetical protein [Clostridia bacterium]